MALLFLCETEILEANETNDLFRPILNSHIRTFSQLNLLSNLVQATLERYTICLLSLEHAQSKVLSATQLKSLSTTLAERFSMLYQMHMPEYFDQKLFNSIVEHLIEQKLVTLNEEGLLIFDDTLTTAVSELESILGTNLRQSLLFTAE